MAKHLSILGLTEVPTLPTVGIRGRILTLTSNGHVYHDSGTSWDDLTATGTGGLAEGEEIVYSKRVDFVSDNLLYKGEAVVGTPDSAAFWRIRRITISALDGDISEEWASGSALFDKVWNDRASLTYS